jgi:hypothetical protein
MFKGCRFAGAAAPSFIQLHFHAGPIIAATDSRQSGRHRLRARFFAAARARFEVTKPKTF